MSIFCTCFAEYDVDNPRIVSKCNHHFHLSCILEWMERSQTCPICDQVYFVFLFYRSPLNSFFYLPLFVSSVSQEGFGFFSFYCSSLSSPFDNKPSSSSFDIFNVLIIKSESSWLLRFIKWARLLIFLMQEMVYEALWKLIKSSLDAGRQHEAVVFHLAAWPVFTCSLMKV